MTTKLIYEIFEEVAGAATFEEKRQAIIRNDSPALRMVLRAALHPKIHFVFDKPLDYNRSDSPPGLGENSVYSAINKVYLFEVGNPRVAPNLTLERKSQLLIQLLEGLEAKEADVFMNMVLKNLNVEGLDSELVMSVYPGLLEN